MCWIFSMPAGPALAESDGEAARCPEGAAPEEKENAAIATIATAKGIATIPMRFAARRRRLEARVERKEEGVPEEGIPYIYATGTNPAAARRLRARTYHERRE